MKENLKARWISKGFLLPAEDESNEKSFEFSLFGRVFIGEFRSAPSGRWDDFMNSGTVHTSFLSIRKCRMLTEEDVVLEFSQIIFLRWTFSLAIVKEKQE